MEKLIFAWDKLGFVQGVKCFAVGVDVVLASFGKGKIKVLDSLTLEVGYEFDVAGDEVEKIVYFKENIFGLVQSTFSIIQVSKQSHYLLQRLNEKVSGAHKDIIWTKSSIFDLDSTQLYKLPESEQEIVQVCKSEGTLIVSSVIKTVLIQKDKIIQIGKKERNGSYGACDYSNSIYAARPLGNMWQANYQGVVMITTSYKIKSEKATFGLMYRMNQFLLSISPKHKNFIVINPQQLSIVHFETYDEEQAVFFSVFDQSLYKLQDSYLLKARILNIDQYFNRLVQEDTNNAVKFVLENEVLHDIELLQPLCFQVFYENKDVDLENKEKFEGIVKKLEEMMQLPVVAFRQEKIEKDEMFDEFLRLNYIEKISKKALGKGKVDKRIRGYLGKNFTWSILINWLLVVIYRKNEELDKIWRLVGISNRSLDFEKFKALNFEARELQKVIEAVL